ncbi:PRMT5 arginine-N-methyltransferase-domain-containing protein [Naematelia encephala]|uniref:PRMT5 arginine-N-methyltransferase-domain-containing protein n=1 Tax=Naematelia encephala TaxID=71784 RepID=A0A1Y2B2G5_9TREE|nr:PRMT5 arginine-N-methyltransferase-domain-containing protein [Naematelia encephala]
MPRVPIALALPSPLPPLPSQPHPAPSPLQGQIQHTISSTDYDTVCLPLTNKLWQDRWERLCLRPVEDEPSPEADAEREAVDREADVWRKEGGLRREECNITRLEESQGLVAIASEWLEMDSPDEGIRFDSELALRAELAYAMYLSLPTLIIPAPSLGNRAHLPSYARAISNLLQAGGPSAYTQISIRIPVSDPVELIGQGPAIPNGPTAAAAASPNKHKRVSSLSTRPTSMHQSQLGALPGMRVTSAASSTMSAKSAAGPSMPADPSSTWEMWDCVRTLCGYHPRLSVTLDLTNPLPPSVGALARWTSEPVKNVFVPASSFIPNARGYPVLSKACQAFLRGMAKQHPTFILSGTSLNRHPTGGANAYLQYLRHITSQPPPSSGSSTSVNVNGAAKVDGAPDYASGYADYLQAPLQPLMDDLGSATYDVFERDPVKYRQYEEAVYLALMDLPQDQKHAITVVGAGRGPLVSCCLRALDRSGRQGKVYAVEKNANAYITLQERKELEWHDTVDIFYGDMRNINIPELADIMVSELLGSIGDNELSPECLDGAMRFLKPSGISIPTSYTAHLAPISSSKLYADATNPARPKGAAETPYVVMMSAVNVISGDAPGRERIGQCWVFEHPRRDLILDPSGAPLTNSHNTRSANLTFSIPHAAPLHGLAGYFEAHLYANVGLSIHPDNAHRVSPDMFSWFPLFFPFKEPLFLPSGSEVEVGIWRLWDSDKNRIWYEWCAEAFLPLPTAAGGGGGGGITSPVGDIGLSPAINTARNAGLASPMMDAPLSPAVGGILGDGVPLPTPARIKIGQTSLHNPAGAHSWIGL